MKIAVLTSGGDSAGMNAVVRAVVKAGILRQVVAEYLTGMSQTFASTEVAKPGSSVKDTRD